MKASMKAICIGLILNIFIIVSGVSGKVLAYETFKLNQDVILIADFEGDDYGEWQVTGDAFGPGPAQGTLPNQMEVTGFLGSGLVNSFYGGDESTGTLTSPLFEIKRPFINFLIGGGGYPDKTCINLLVNGKIVRTAEGPNTEPGGSEELNWQGWDVRDLSGQRAKIQIVDQYTGGWGHINIDHIVQSFKKRETIFNKEREMQFNQKYLNIPVKNDASKRLISLFVDGEKVREFDVELAQSEPDFWVYLDVSEFQGQQGTLRINKYYSERDTGFDAIFNADSFPGQENLYSEKRRPQFHFTSKRGWNNDTNGMVYYDGQYHLFYQHNPYGWNWGNMTWGHAVSTDMVHWQEWGDAIHPDESGTIFSGSAVVDHNNTAGFQTSSEKPIVCIYTSAGGTSQWSEGEPFTQSIAYSNDRGHTFTKYENNPVIGHIADGTRDPKVFRHESSDQWVMVLWIEGDKLSFFTSSDLKKWEKQSDLYGFFECPELFELPVDGNSSNTKWVVYGASGDYKIGEFDGTQFVPETGLIKYEYGNCFYASQTFNNIPPSDGRRVQMGWGRINMPDMPFNQMILFPVSLTLHQTPDGIRMYANPVEEIQNLHQQHWRWSNQTVSPGDNPLSSIEGELFHIKAEIEPQNAQICKFIVRDTPIVYDAISNELSCHGQTAPLEPENGKVNFEILVDRMSIEIYANDGRLYMPIGIDLVDNSDSLEFLSEGGDTLIETMDIYQLESIWF